jgi:REP element-mobilizing transposase RayT
MPTDRFQHRYRIPSARAAWHRYNGGAYFVTVCTADMECFFGNIHNGAMQLNGLGGYVDECVRKMENIHSDISIPVYIIMPNHIHLIVFVDDSPAKTPYNGTSIEQKPNTPVETSYNGVSVTQTPHTVETSYNGVSIKQTPKTPDALETPYYDVSTGDNTKNEKMQAIAKQCGRLSHVISRFKSAVTKHANTRHIRFGWQTRFHDRIIRNQDEMNRIAEYIHNNPAQWESDELYTRNAWPQNAPCPTSFC